MSFGWVVLALISAVNVGTASIVEKNILHKQHAMEFSVVFSLFAMILTTPLWLFADPAALSLKATGLIFLASLLGTLAFLLVAKALRHIAISITSPFFAFEPLATLIVAFILLNEKVTLMQGAGILVLITGTYLLAAQEQDNLLEPFKHIFKMKHIRYVLLAVVLYAFGSSIDKKILGNPVDGGLGVPVLTYIPLTHFFIAINFIIMMLVLQDGFRGIQKGVKHNWKWILVITVLILVSRFALTYAISLPGVLISLLIPIKRLSVLFSTIIGGELFHEKHVLKKGLACAIMIIGAVLITLNL